MDMLILIGFFLFGMVFGSFFNVVGLRVPLGEPFGNDRSRCPDCKHQLTSLELIPIISYIIQGGKCRNCKKPISPIYPIMELVTGVLFSFVYWQLGFTWELLTMLLLVSMTTILIVSDMAYMLIPNKILLFFLPLFIVMRIIEPLDPWWLSLVGAVGGFGLVLVIILASRGGMGAGDMKLMGVLGIILGFSKVIFTFFLAALIGAIIGLTLRAFQKIKKKQPIPFGPYILIAALFTYFYGDLVIDWYLGLLR